MVQGVHGKAASVLRLNSVLEGTSLRTPASEELFALKPGNEEVAA
jgi:hypothetical protein